MTTETLRAALADSQNHGCEPTTSIVRAYAEVEIAEQLKRIADAFDRRAPVAPGLFASTGEELPH